MIESGIDFSHNQTVSGKSIKARGFSFVINYLGTSTPGYLTEDLANSYISAGLSIVSVYEVTERTVGGILVNYDPKVVGDTKYMTDNLTYAYGVIDGRNAYNDAKSINQTLGSAIYFAVDGNAVQSDISSVIAYFEGIAEGFSAASSGHPAYQVGVYGSGYVLDTIFPRLAAFKWLAYAGWEGSAHYTNYNIAQTFNNDTTIFQGETVDLDSTSAGYFGEWGSSAAPTPDLVISGVTVSPSAALGGGLDISAAIKNNSMMGVGAFDFSVYISPYRYFDSNARLLANMRVASLAGEATASWGESVLLPSWITAPGQYYVIVVANQAHTVSESDYSNDSFSTAFDVVASGTGLIYTVGDLERISKNPSGSYRLGANIDASITATWNGGAGFLPIGSVSAPFTGTLDGNGFTIQGLTINANNSPAAGLFAYTAGTIENLALLNATIKDSGANTAGSIAAFNSGVISHSYATGSVTATFAGGLVGNNTGTILQSYSSVTAQGFSIDGGLVGINAGHIEQSYSTGSVAGGPGAFVGGLVGEGVQTSTAASIDQSYATGRVSALPILPLIGGLVGNPGLQQVTNSVWDTQATGVINASGGGALTNVAGWTTGQLQSGLLPSGFDPTVWQATSGQYPTLKWQQLSAGPSVYLPTITPAGAFQFIITVLSGQTYFIDPAVAAGYIYATGSSDPNFSSVLLPDIQSNPYRVTFLNNGMQETDTVAPKSIFNFPDGGVSTFTVSGIAAADALDPTDPNAFVTGLTFAANGQFTGTQTPLVDPGPTAASGSVTEGHNRAADVTALINGLITPGMLGDAETLTNVSATQGTVALRTGGAISYVAPANGPDTISFTVVDQYGDAAIGHVEVTVDPGPNIATQPPLIVEKTQSTVLGTVTPGLPGDTLTLTQTGGSPGTLKLGPPRADGTQQVIYTAPATVGASMVDTVAYTVADQFTDSTTSVSASVQVDAGPSIAPQLPSVVEKNQTTVIGTITPGLPGDTLTLTAAAGSLGTLSLGTFLANGTQQVIYTAPSRIPSSTADTVSYQIADQHDGAVAAGNAAVQLDAGPSIMLLAVAPGTRNKTVTVATTTAGLPSDTLSLVVVSPPQSGKVTLQGTSVQFTPTTGFNLLKPITFSFEIKDQLGAVTPPASVIIGGDVANNVTGSAGGNTDISLGNGLNRVTLLGGGNVIDAGNGLNLITGGTSNNTVILGDGVNDVMLGDGNNKVTLGNGLNSVTLSGGGNIVTVGNGASTVKVGGSANQIKVGNGINVVRGGTGDTITLAGNNGSLSLYATNEMLFLGDSGVSIDDLSQGMKLVLSGGVGIVKLTDFAKDLVGVIDLRGGLGAFTTPQAVVAALQSDHHGGTLLSFGQSNSIDFIGVPKSQLSASNFRIG